MKMLVELDVSRSVPILHIVWRVQISQFKLESTLNKCAQSPENTGPTPTIPPLPLSPTYARPRNEIVYTRSVFSLSGCRSLYIKIWCRFLSCLHVILD